MSTTTLTPALELVNRIIQHEIPDAVPGMDYLRTRKLTGEIRDFHVIPAVVETILCPTNNADLHGLLRELSLEVLDLICTAKFYEDLPEGAEWLEEEEAKAVRSIISKIKELN